MHVAATVIPVHVDDIFSFGRKGRCDQCGVNLSKDMPVSSLGDLRSYECGFSSGRVSGTVTISQQTVAETMVAKFGATQNKEMPKAVGLK